LAYFRKSFYSGSLLFSYLIWGSGSGVPPPQRPDARQLEIKFAQTLPRKVYKYSVVPGGVESPEELAEARRTDPVVAANFADFGNHTTITHLKEDMFVYVAYRVGDKVYYTKKKHKVCKGEEVITDGKNYARTRCANRMTKVFKAPGIVFNEPKPPELDLIEPPEPAIEIPPDPLLAATNYPILPTPFAPVTPPIQTGANTGVKPITSTTGASSEVIFPAYFPFSGIAPGLLVPPRSSTTPPSGPTPPVTPPPAVVTTPEPGAFGTLLLGGAALVWMWRRKRQAI
jgi:hypothetical protein